MCKHFNSHALKSDFVASCSNFVARVTPPLQVTEISSINYLYIFKVAVIPVKSVLLMRVFCLHFCGPTDRNFN
jgi:hypothetical protein